MPLTARALLVALSITVLAGASASALQAQSPSGAPPAGKGAPAKGTPVVVGPPLGAFAEERVAVVPIQSWRPDTTGWSTSIVWSQLRLAIDSAVTTALQDRGMGRRWAYPADVVRIARRNPTFQGDAYALGVGRWRAMLPEIGSPIPSPLADNLRFLTALGDMRQVLVPMELRVEGEVTLVRLVLVDTRARTVLFAGDLVVPGGAGVATGLATRMADLFLEP
ncbi:MAG: hypothetical protein ACK5ED_04830 [Gemmatimonadota bacterium]